MKLNIGLNETDIKKAIDFINPKINNLLDNIIQMFIKFSMQDILRIASVNLLTTANIDNELVDDVWRHWTVTQSKVGIDYIGKIINTHDKAVYLEFGVGRVGSENPHTNAKKSNVGGGSYEYDIPTSAKRSDGYWFFVPEDPNKIDIGTPYYKQVGKGTKFVMTKGQPATMFLYNAMIEFITSNQHKKCWARATSYFFGG